MHNGRRRGRPTVEGTASITLNINALVRATGGRSPAGLRMEASIDGGRPQEILARLDLDPEAGTGTLALKYDLQHATVATGLQRQTLRLAATPCRFGGCRWWIVCPETGRRVVKIHLPNGGRRFLSRAAYGLAYQSQRETVAGRAWRTIRKLERRVGQTAGAGAMWTKKPKWMRWRTFNALRQKREAAEEVLDADLIRAVDLLARYLPA